jgi:hypothetical protein
MKLEPVAGTERFVHLLAREYPLRRPQNSFRVINGLADIRNHFIPDRHEQLNGSATFILNLCDGEHSIVDIWHKLIDQFHTDDRDAALSSIVRLVRYLQRYFVLYGCTIKDEQSNEIGMLQRDRQQAARIV